MLEDGSYDRHRTQVSVEVLGLSVRPMTCLKRGVIETVEQLISRTPAELMALPNFGQTSLDEIVESLRDHDLELARVSGPHPEAVFSPSASRAGHTRHDFMADHRRSGFLDAVGDLAGWAVEHTGAATFGDLFNELVARPGWMTDPSLPGTVRESILEARLEPLTPVGGLPDGWRGRLEQLDNELRSDAANAAVLDGRLLLADRRDVKTLEEIADRFDVTREAIRQRELRLVARIGHLLHDEFVSERLDELVREIGSAVPEHLLAGSGLDLSDPVARLLLFLTGFRRGRSGKPGRPVYHRVVQDGGAWILYMGAVDLDRLVRAAFNGAQRDGHCGSVAMTDSLMALFGSLVPGDEALDGLLIGGERQSLAESLIASSGSVRRVQDRIVDWTGTLADKAVVVLSVAGEPMDRDELAGAVNQGSVRGTINAFQADERVMRVGTRLYALASWGLEEYGNIVAHMREVLETRGGAEMPVEGLADELEERFDINRSSVVIHSTTNPTFVSDGSMVRLRRDGEAVESKPLGEEFGTLRIGDGLHAGRWAMRLEVDHNHLRGSGSPLPRSIALAMGMQPGLTGTFESDHGPVNWGWTQSNGSLGSIRTILESIGAVEGDLVFVVAEGPDRIAFVHVGDRGGATLEERLSNLLQADLGVLYPFPAVAHAVGLRPDAGHDELLIRLEDRWRRHAGNEEERLLRSLLEMDEG